jgi:hypothetical protein
MTQQDNNHIVACKNFEQDLVLYYYGELGDLDRRYVDSHLRSCKACALYLKQLNTLLPQTVQMDDPPEKFWNDYRREMRYKLAVAQQKRSWWRSVVSPSLRWTVPVFATAAVVGLALTFALSKGFWRANEIPQDDEAFIEALPVAENLEFFKNMEVLDNMDLLEFMGNQENGAA